MNMDFYPPANVYTGKYSYNLNADSDDYSIIYKNNMTGHVNMNLKCSGDPVQYVTVGKGSDITKYSQVNFNCGQSYTLQRDNSIVIIAWDNEGSA
jgi:uncharacterized membrane protein